MDVRELVGGVLPQGHQVLKATAIGLYFQQTAFTVVWLEPRNISIPHAGHMRET